MPNQLSNTVKIVYADPKKVGRALRNYVQRITAKHPEVLGILWFGSYPQRKYSPASDIDLVIILSQSAKQFMDRMSDYVDLSLPVDMDVFPYTLAEWRQMKKEKRGIVQHALREGKVLFGAARF